MYRRKKIAFDCEKAAKIVAPMLSSAWSGARITITASSVPRRGSSTSSSPIQPWKPTTIAVAGQPDPQDGDQLQHEGAPQPGLLPLLVEHGDEAGQPPVEARAC